MKPSSSRRRAVRRARHRTDWLRVEALEERRMLATFTVTNIGDEGPGSLRQAVLDANAAAGPDVIDFAIRGTSPHNIFLAASFQARPLLVTDSVTIDATTQPGYAGSPRVAFVGPGISGDNGFVPQDGLVLQGSDSVVRGLALGGFVTAIRLEGDGRHRVEGNFLGVDPDGIRARSNRQGVAVFSSGNVIGGTTPAARNVISGNAAFGVDISVPATTGNVVQGNYIGVDATGAVALGNGGDRFGGGGVRVVAGAGATIGGAVAGAGNVISGNIDHGIVLGDLFGSTSPPVQGDTVVQGNTIAFNGGAGVVVASVSGTSILSNAIHSNARREISLDAYVPRVDVTLEVAVPGPGGMTIVGAIGGAETGPVRVQFFAAAEADENGSGQGQSYLGEVTVPAGATRFTATVAAPPAGQAVVAATATGPDGTTGEFSRAIPATPITADLAVSLDGPVGPVLAGRELTYTIHVTNGGPDRATEVRLTDALPAGVALVSATASQGYISHAGGVVAAVLGELEAGAEATVMITVAPTQAGTITNSVEVAGRGDYPVGGNNSASVTTRVDPAVELAVALTAAPIPAKVRVPLEYTLTVTNHGPLPATGVTLVHPLPPGVIFVSATGGVTPVAGVLTFDIGTLAINGTVLLTLVVIPTTAGTLASTASVSSHEADRDGANNTATGTITVDELFLTVTTTADTGPGSLRQAIFDANAAAGLDTIAFAIPGTGPHTIRPTSALPTITDPVIIDGYTQGSSTPDDPTDDARPNTLAGGKNAVLRIELDGDGTNGSFIDGEFVSASGLRIAAGHSTVRGLVINRFRRPPVTSSGGGAGIELVGPDGGNWIEGNFLGTDITGTVGSFSAEMIGVLISGPGNIVGGTEVGAGNLISGNYYGIWIGPGGTGNRIQGNRIGTDITGSRALPNQIGVSVVQTPDNTIGGAAAGARNVISGNTNRSIFIAGSGATGNSIQGNFIGIDAAGTAALGNGASGIELDDHADGTTIGGAMPGAGNVISGNGHAGAIIGASKTLIQGNFIGTNAAGGAALGNRQFGVRLGFGNTLGGTAPGAGNLISGNDNGGVDINGGNNLVQGNRIGTDAAGTTALGNAGPGIRLSAATGNRIGGADAGAGNIIAFNASDGVTIGLGFYDPATGNAILSNAIHSNAGLGINLKDNNVGDQVDTNDPGDVDTGPNNYQNFPILTSVVPGATGTTAQGTLASTPNTAFTVQFFASAAPDPSGYGEGQTFLGQATVTTGGSGHASFSAQVAAPPPGQPWVTATATDAAGNTSEFSRAVPVGTNVVATTTTVSTSVNPTVYGQPVTFTATVGAASGPDTPTGTVTFLDRSTPFGTRALDASGRATITLFPGGGDHVIAAAYGGDVAFAPSTSTALIQTVLKAPTTLRLDNLSHTYDARPHAATVITDPAGLSGVSITYTRDGVVVDAPIDAGSYTVVASLNNPSHQAADVTGTLVIARATPTVHVADGTFTYDAQAHPATGSVVGVDGAALGTPTFTYSGLGAAPANAGTYAVVGSFAGDANYTAASAGATITINPAALTVTAVGATKVYGAALPAFTASYTGFVPGEGPGVLGGTLTFHTAATAASPVGTYPVTPGGLTSTNYAITYAAGTLTVIQAASTTTIITSANPSVFGQPVTFTATVSAVTGAGTPTGTVTFRDGAATIGTASLDASGRAALTTAALGLGSHAITAVYGGDGAFTTSLATALTQVVDTAVADLSVTLVDSPDPVEKGRDLTYRIIVTNNGPGAARGKTLVDQLPEDVTFVSTSQGDFEPGHWEQEDGRVRRYVPPTVTADLDTLAPGDTVTVVIVVRPKTVGTITNVAGVSGGTADPDPSNNMATRTTTVRAPGPLVAGFDWIMPRHFGNDVLTTDFNQDTGKTTLSPGPDGIPDYPWEDPDYEGLADYLNLDDRWTVRLDGSSTSGAGPNVRYQWAVPGGPIEPPSSSPVKEFTFPEQGTYPVTLTVIDEDGRTSTVTRDVVVRNYFIASIGDSYGSGEGAPDTPQQFNDAGFWIRGPHWENQRAHRSHHAGAAQTALAIEQEDPHNSVTFVSLAASGATIVDGVLDGFIGTEVPRVGNPADLPPQLDELARLAQGREIDALFISIGGNDVQFVPIVKKLVLSGSWNGGVGDPTKTIQEYLQPIQEEFFRDLNGDGTEEHPGLLALYGRIDQRLRQGDLKVKEVYLTEYPDQTRGRNGTYTWGPLGDLFGFISPELARWASTVAGAALRAKMKEAAVKYGWHYVGGISDQFSTHGYPAADGQRWINSASDGLLAQGVIRFEKDYHADPINTAGYAAQVEAFAAIQSFYREVGPLTFLAVAGVELILAPALVAPWAGTAAGAVLGQMDTKGAFHPNREGYQAYARSMVASLHSASIRGQVYEDLNGNGVRDAGEDLGLAHRRVFVDVDNDGRLDLDEPWADTDDTGHYALEDLAPGTYVIRQLASSRLGWFASDPDATVTIAANLLRQGPTVVDFGQYGIGAITGRAFRDDDRDGIRDGLETVLADRSVYLDLDNSGSLETRLSAVPSAEAPVTIPAALTINRSKENPEGELVPGEAESHLTVSGLAGLLADLEVALNFSPGVDPDSDLQITLIGPRGQFVFVPGTHVRLSDFNNGDPNGTWVLKVVNFAESPVVLTGWSLALTSGEPYVRTGPDGLYAFGNLKPGTYVVREVPPDGWGTSAPSAGFHTPVVLSGQVTAGLDFGNFPLNNATIGLGSTGRAVTLTSPAGTSLTNVEVKPISDREAGILGLSFPIGLLQYEVRGVAHGGPAIIYVFPPSDVKVDRYIKYGPTPDNRSPHYYDFAFDGTTGAKIFPGRIELTFVDGQRGDDDLTADGVIREPGGPAFLANRPPELVGIGEQAVDEDGTLRFAVGATDPDADQTLTYSLDPGAPAGAHIDPATGVFTWTAPDGPALVPVTVRVSDDGSPSLGVTRTILINVADVPPSVALAPAGPSDEGSAFVGSGSFRDPGVDAPWTATVDYGDGTGPRMLPLNPDKTFALGHVYADDGTYTVTVAVTDKDGTSGSASMVVTVRNVAPRATLRNGGDVDEGSSGVVSFAEAFDPSPVDAAAGFTYSFDFDADGTFEVLGSSSASAVVPAGFLDDGPGPRAVRARITDKDGGATDYTAAIPIRNVAPTAAIREIPAPSAEGSVILLTGSATDPSTADTAAGFSYSWAVTRDDGPHTTVTGLGSGNTFRFTPEDNGTYIVTLTVADKDGGISAVVSRTVAVSNVAPSATIGVAPAGGVRGQTLAFAGLFTDPGSADTWTATVDYGDGTGPRLLPLNPDKTFAFRHVYAAAGTYSVTVAVTDDDGSVSTAASSVTVGVVGLAADPFDPSKTALFVGGTTEPDTIVFTPARGAGDVLVRLDGVELGIFHPTGRIIAFGQAGDDNIQVAGALAWETVLHGDDGDDRLRDGEGNGILAGGDGDDLLIGGGGNDLLVGGPGADRLVGHAGDAILIAGTTDFDADDAALCAILAEWDAHRTAGRLSDLSVFDDDSVDTLTGGPGQAWFFYNPDVGDRATDLKPGHRTTLTKRKRR